MLLHPHGAEVTYVPELPFGLALEAALVGVQPGPFAIDPRGALRPQEASQIRSPFQEPHRAFDRLRHSCSAERGNCGAIFVALCAALPSAPPRMRSRPPHGTGLPRTPQPVGCLIRGDGGGAAASAGGVASAEAALIRSRAAGLNRQSNPRRGGPDRSGDRRVSRGDAAGLSGGSRQASGLASVCRSAWPSVLRRPASDHGALCLAWCR